MKSPLIQEVPVDSLPRERLLSFGVKALSNQELMAILLRTGWRKDNVIVLAGHLLKRFESLHELGQASIEELTQTPGIGPVKAIEIIAALELGRRCASSQLPKYGQITSTRSAGQWLMIEMADLQQEYLIALFLNTKNEIIKKKTIFIGTVNSSVAHPREIFKEAVKYPTARIILGHNHPSGDVAPSTADIQFTKRMIECGQLMGIEILDHLIIGHENYLSLHESTDIFD